MRLRSSNLLGVYASTVHVFEAEPNCHALLKILLGYDPLGVPVRIPTKLWDSGTAPRKGQRLHHIKYAQGPCRASKWLPSRSCQHVTRCFRPDIDGGDRCVEAQTSSQYDTGTIRKRNKSVFCYFETLRSRDRMTTRSNLKSMSSTPQQ